MGADLYMKGQDEYKEQFQQAFKDACRRRDVAQQNGNKAEMNQIQDEVDKYYSAMYGESPFYFRDSYNCSSVFWQMGLSWWRDLDQFTKKNGDIGPRGARALLKVVKSREIPPADELNLDNAADADTPEGLESWRNYFIEKRERFMAFLQKCIDEKRPIRCSV